MVKEQNKISHIILMATLGNISNKDMMTEVLAPFTLR
jgi:hypothetical protein